jgi:uncharacterized membrane-anchored protein YhcB (DUF1043 family)
MKDAMNNKLEEDFRLFKKFHDEQLEQHVQTSASNIDQLHTEIRTLKRHAEEKAQEVGLSFLIQKRLLKIE